MYYYGARYYDPRTSVWQSVDPILEKYLPSGDPDKDKNLPGMGGVFNSANLAAYTQSHNNPVRYVDPDGNATNPVTGGQYITNNDIRSNASNPLVGKFGMTRNGGKKEHRGTDLNAKNGVPLTAPISGRAIVLEDHKDLGDAVFIVNDKGDSSIMMGLAHLSKLNVKNGQTIKEGELIGFAGSTGNARGMPVEEQHTHLKVKVDGVVVDPVKFFKDNAIPRNLIE